MALRLRRGTDAERLLITPLEGELIYTTDTNRLYVGDGQTTGGIPVLSAENAGFRLTDLVDVELENDSSIPSDGDLLAWDENNQLWRPEPVSSNVNSIGDLVDVNDNGVTGGQVLKYDSVSGIWQPADDIDTSLTLSNQSIDDLGDVQTVGAVEGQSLVYDETAGSWKPAFVSGTGGGIINDNSYNINIIGNDSTVLVNSDTAEFRGNLLGDVFGDILQGTDLSGDTLTVNTANVIDQTITGQLTTNNLTVNGNIDGNFVGTVNNTEVNTGTLIGIDTQTTTLEVGDATIDNGRLSGVMLAGDSSVLFSGVSGEYFGTLRGDVANQTIFTDSITSTNGSITTLVAQDITTDDLNVLNSFNGAQATFTTLNATDLNINDIVATGNINGNFIGTINSAVAAIDAITGLSVNVSTVNATTINTRDLNVTEVLNGTFDGTFIGTVQAEDSSVIIDGTTGNITSPFVIADQVNGGNLTLGNTGNANLITNRVSGQPLVFGTVDTNGVIINTRRTLFGSTNAAVPDGRIDVIVGSPNLPVLNVAGAYTGAGETQISINRANGTKATPTVVQPGDYVGAVVFNGYNGGSYQPLGGVDAEVTGTPTGAYTPGQINIYSRKSDGSRDNCLSILDTGNVAITHGLSVTEGITGDLTGSVFFDDSARVLDATDGTMHIANVNVIGTTTNSPVTPGSVDSWLEVNVNGATKYLPLYV